MSPIEDPIAAHSAVCIGRLGTLEFGPFTLSEFVSLEGDQSLPDDLEFRIEGTELWWNWKSIAALGGSARVGNLGPLNDWYTRQAELIAGPMTVLEITRQLESGDLAATAAIQIGDGDWSPVIDLLVAPEPPIPAACRTSESPESMPPVAVAVAAAAVVACEEPPMPVDQKKQQLEAWLSKTMPDRVVTVAVVERKSSATAEAIFAAALVGVAEQADQAARSLSPPWIWGTLACVVVASVALAYLQPRGPDDLDLTALRKLKSAHEAIRAVRASQPDEEIWQEFAADLNRDLDPLKEALARTKRASEPIKESLYWAIEYRLPRILKEGRLEPSSAEAEFSANLKEAERHIARSRR